MTNMSPKDNAFLTTTLRNLYYKDILFAVFLKADIYKTVSYILSKEQKRSKSFNDKIIKQILFRLWETIHLDTHLFTHQQEFFNLRDNFTPEYYAVNPDLLNVIRCNWMEPIELYAGLGSDQDLVVRHMLKLQGNETLRSIGTTRFLHGTEEDYKNIFELLFQEAKEKLTKTNQISA